MRSICLIARCHCLPLDWRICRLSIWLAMHYSWRVIGECYWCLWLGGWVSRSWRNGWSFSLLSDSSSGHRGIATRIGSIERGCSARKLCCLDRVLGEWWFWEVLLIALWRCTGRALLSVGSLLLDWSCRIGTFRVVLGHRLDSKGQFRWRRSSIIELQLFITTAALLSVATPI